MNDFNLLISTGKFVLRRLLVVAVALLVLFGLAVFLLLAKNDPRSDLYKERVESDLHRLSGAQRRRGAPAPRRRELRRLRGPRRGEARDARVHRARRALRHTDAADRARRTGTAVHRPAITSPMAETGGTAPAGDTMVHPPRDIPDDLEEAILALVEERNAVILAHYYQEDEIQDLALAVGATGNNEFGRDNVCL